MFSAWFGGFGPGLLAATLSILAFKYYYAPPLHTLAVTQTFSPELTADDLIGNGRRVDRAPPKLLATRRQPPSPRPRRWSRLGPWNMPWSP
jgi:hypothetical protein